MIDQHRQSCFETYLALSALHRLRSYLHCSPMFARRFTPFVDYSHTYDNSMHCLTVSTTFSKAIRQSLTNLTWRKVVACSTRPRKSLGTSCNQLRKLSYDTPEHANLDLLGALNSERLLACSFSFKIIYRHGTHCRYGSRSHQPWLGHGFIDSLKGS